MTTIRLADHADYRMTLHRAGPAQTDRIIVTFGVLQSGLADAGFATEFVLGQGLDTIHVAQRGGTQYQGLSIAAFRDVVGPAVAGYSDVLTYGASLGGYAAVYYGGCINARMIAASPMFPAWPGFRNKKFADLPIRHVDMTRTPLSRHQPVVIFDPELRGDTRMVNEVVRPAYPGLRRVPVPHGGHQVLVTLSQAGLLKPLIRGIIARDEIADVTLPGEGSAVWHGLRGMELRQSEPAGAIAELERSLAIAPSRRYFNEMIRLLLRQGRTAEAQARVDAARAAGSAELVLVPITRSEAVAAGLDV